MCIKSEQYVHKPAVSIRDRRFFLLPGILFSAGRTMRKKGGQLPEKTGSAICGRPGRLCARKGNGLLLSSFAALAAQGAGQKKTDQSHVEHGAPGIGSNDAASGAAANQAVVQISHSGTAQNEQPPPEPWLP